MIQRFLNWARAVLQRLFHKNGPQLNIQMNSDMIAALEKWQAMYENEPPWMSSDVKPMNLPSSVTEELVRLMLLEAEITVSGSARADWMNDIIVKFVDKLQEQLEEGLALGGIAFKPYPRSDGGLGIDTAPIGRFFPLAYDSNGNLTGGIFVDRYNDGRIWYTRFESHSLDKTMYTITNTVYQSYNQYELGTQTTLDTADKWRDLGESVTIANVKQVLFGFFKVPSKNKIDTESPLAPSVFAGAERFFQDADEQWARIMWEYRGTELAVDISSRAFKPDKDGNAVIPKSQSRLFRALDIGENEHPLYEVFSPQIRSEPLFAGFNRILQRVEFACGLAYGTLSDPQTVEKTAEEIKSSKQRSYSRVRNLQKSLQNALDELLYAMDVWADAYDLAPSGKYEVSYSWDDSIITDTDKEFAQRLQLVSANILSRAELRAWYLNQPIEQAEAELPDDGGMDPFGFGSGDE